MTHLIKIKASINEQEFKIIIDTGAIRSFIHLYTAQQLKEATARHLPIREIENHEEVIFNVQIGNHIFQVKFITDEEIPFDVHLGSDFLKEFNAIINYQNNTLKLEGIQEIPLITQDEAEITINDLLESGNSSSSEEEIEQ